MYTFNFLTFFSPCPTVVDSAIIGSCDWMDDVGYPCSPSDCMVCIPETNNIKHYSDCSCRHIIWWIRQKEINLCLDHEKCWKVVPFTYFQGYLAQQQLRKVEESGCLPVVEPWCTGGLSSGLLLFCREVRIGRASTVWSVAPPAALVDYSQILAGLNLNGTHRENTVKERISEPGVHFSKSHWQIFSVFLT